MTTENDSNDKQATKTDAAGSDDKEKISITNSNSGSSGDPGRTPGSAEGDEETIDEDIRQKEAEGKL